VSQPRALEQPNGRGQTHLIARSDGDDARDELLKYAPEAALRQLEHGRVRMLRHRGTNTAQDDVNIEGPLSSGHARVEGRSGARLSPQRSAAAKRSAASRRTTAAEGRRVVRCRRWWRRRESNLHVLF
jgi:hypothetical protein